MSVEQVPSSIHPAGTDGRNVNLYRSDRDMRAPAPEWYDGLDKWL